MFGLFIFCLVIAVVEFMLVIDLKPKVGIPLYVFVIALLILFVPGLNIIEIVISGILLTMACHNSYDLAGSNPVSKFFKMLNRNT
jgi:hypothetical protein|nr:MAG TPA: hypothetical protein [Caudoviricetes sp.]